ncbi:hypothetical protein K501DRAFT_275427 [Backusella circina FSU 941]|nr:hypothetical protein K501DRAFT_275427 [Backusella circina FSU 941]
MAFSQCILVYILLFDYYLCIKSIPSHTLLRKIIFAQLRRYEEKYDLGSYYHYTSVVQFSNCLIVQPLPLVLPLLPDSTQDFSAWCSTWQYNPSALILLRRSLIYLYLQPLLSLREKTEETPKDILCASIYKNKREMSYRDWNSLTQHLTIGSELDKGFGMDRIVK